MLILMRLLGRRMLFAFAALLGASALIFIGTEILPGDVAASILGQSATPEALANIRAELGLYRPATERYFDWLFGILQGDLGQSLANRQPIGEMISGRLGNTFFSRRLHRICGYAVGDYIRINRGEVSRPLAGQNAVILLACRNFVAGIFYRLYFHLGFCGKTGMAAEFGQIDAADGFF